MSIDANSNHFFRVGVTQSLKKHGMSPSRECLSVSSGFAWVSVTLFQLGVSFPCRPLNNYPICSTVATGNRPEIILALTLPWYHKWSFQ